ncbi:hypothetical protein HMPREF1983_00749 [Gemella bergeri ATCC 700627]|uniref:Uncharacterized protein n=1 Tax=Gemella bergeri ATCC 700627 TaxID=1321820 RepID=U2S719_9BACL|nr:hypothetical protein [Gemella bergeri]ERK58602.1 hypothetical protein HMPREF1983_00749 [Gemella bergeri ATCC 700627]
MGTYSYNKKFIEKLNLFKIKEHYDFNNEEYNKAIFFALSSLEKHIKEFSTNNIKTKSLLFGDYYSFEYYSLLKKDSVKLKKLTDVMKIGYQKLLNNNSSVDKFIINIIYVWFEFYGKKIDNDDRNFIKKVVWAEN